MFKGRQAAPPMELRYRRRTPRQEAKLARLEEIRQSREHLGDPTPLKGTDNIRVEIHAKGVAS